MDRKKILILICSLVLIVGGVFVAVRLVKNNPTKEQRSFADNFAQKTQAAKMKTITGNVESIDIVGIGIRLGQEHFEVKINKNTPVTVINSGAKKTNHGQISDIKLNDTIKVDYDKDTLNAIMITIVRP